MGPHNTVIAQAPEENVIKVTTKEAQGQAAVYARKYQREQHN